MTRVKICGITCENDIICLNRYLPDYCGFIFAESRRCISQDKAHFLAGKLDRAVKRAGVFVNADPGEVARVAERAGLDVVQVHGDETPEYVECLRCRLRPGIEIWKAIRVKDEASIARMKEYSADRFLLDACVEGLYGGAGKRFDWRLAADAAKYGDIILAGGLNPDNVLEAVRTVRPFAVDVSSGVETVLCKDESKIRDFIYKVRGMKNVEMEA